MIELAILESIYAHTDDLWEQCPLRLPPFAMFADYGVTTEDIAELLVELQAEYDFDVTDYPECIQDVVDMVMCRPFTRLQRQADNQAAAAYNFDTKPKPKQTLLTKIKNLMKHILPLTMLLALTGCERIELPSTSSSDADTEGALISISTHQSTTRAAVADISSRLSFAVFHNGERVRTTEHQERGIDDDYGTYSLRLDKGVYDLVVIAHNGANNCTITSPDKVTFRNGHLTDTFCGYTQFTVNEQDTALAVNLHRVVARITLTSTSQHPSDVSQMKFYYTGGSSTLSPRLMQGIVQSRQTEIMDAAVPDTYTFYTFPYRSTTSTLKLTVYSMDSQGTEIDETTYTNIPVELSRTTKLTASLFDKHGISITIPDTTIQWGEDITVNL